MRRFEPLLKTLLVGFLTVIQTTLFSISGQSALKQDMTQKTDSVIQPVYTTSRLVTAKPVIDGKLDDECWKVGTWAGDYTQFIPDEGAKPTYPTEMNIQYDDKNLYIAFRAYDDEPDKILQLAGGRDDIVGDMVDTCYSLACSNSYSGCSTNIGSQIGYLDIDGFHHV